MSKSMDKLATDELPVEPEEVATFQEAVPVPWFAGTRKLAVRWIDAATNRITKKAKTPAGKK